MEVPSDPPGRCPVCDAPHDSVSVHYAGLMVNMRDNERYHRVCFNPLDRDGEPAIEFYHHTHAQVRASRGDADVPSTDAPGGE